MSYIQIYEYSKLFYVSHLIIIVSKFYSVKNDPEMISLLLDRYQLKYRTYVKRYNDNGH